MCVTVQEFTLGCPGTSFTSGGAGEVRAGRCTAAGTFQVEGDTLASLAGLGCTRQPVYMAEVVGEQSSELVFDK